MGTALIEGVFLEPLQHTPVEFLLGDRCGGAVGGASRDPKSGVTVQLGKPLGVPGKDIDVLRAVYQQEGNSGAGDGIRRVRALKVKPVAQPRVEQGEFDDRASDRSAEPGPEPDVASNALQRDRVEFRVRRLRYDATEGVFGREGLQQLRRAHRFAEAVHAACTLHAQPEYPAMYVVALEQAVGCETPAAFAMRASVGKQDPVPALQEDATVPSYTFPIVAHAVEKDDCVTVVVRGDDVPPTQLCFVCRGNGHVLKFCMELLTQNPLDV